MNSVKRKADQKPDLLSLPDHILCGILFSGYLTVSMTVAKVLCLCKRIKNLYDEHMGYLSIQSHGSIDDKTIRWLTKRAGSLEYLDLSFCGVSIPIYTAAPFANSLLYLSLRGTNIDDKSMSNVAQLKNLQFLDISLYNHPERITNRSCYILFQLRQLRWLNISGTNINEDGIGVVCRSNRSLSYLSACTCRRMTGKVLEHLHSLPIVFLDISGISVIFDNQIMSAFAREDSK